MFDDDGILINGIGDDMSEYEDEEIEGTEDEFEPREDNFRDDVDADADVLKSAGWGTDEDYGGFDDMGRDFYGDDY